MKNPFSFIKKIIFWELGRNTVTYEIICAIYIGLLVFLPVNSNGWFNPGDSVQLNEGTSIELQRDGTTLYLKWSEDERPDLKVLETFVRERFGAKTVVIEDKEHGDNTMKVIPGGWKWRDLLPLQ